MAIQRTDGTVVGVIEQRGDVVLMRTKVSGGHLPKTYSTHMWVEMDFSDLTREQIIERACEAVQISARHKIWTAKNGPSTKELDAWSQSRTNPYKLKVTELEKRIARVASMDKVVEQADVHQLEALIKAAQEKMAKIRALEELNQAIK